VGPGAGTASGNPPLVRLVGGLDLGFRDLAGGGVPLDGPEAQVVANRDDNSLGRADVETLVVAGGEDAGRWTGMGRQVRAMALSPFAHQRLTSLLSRQRQADLEHLARLIEAGRLTPVIGKAYPLARLPGSPGGDRTRAFQASPPGCAPV
jgi:Zinc-binding dehydrogenase